MSLNISTALLRSLLSLTEKREKLVSELAAVESEIGRIVGDFAPTSGKTASPKVRRVKSAKKTGQTRSDHSFLKALKRQAMPVSPLRIWQPSWG